MAENPQKIEPIQAVARALMVLEELSDKGSLSLNELHKSTGINKASLLRLLQTLLDQEFVHKSNEEGLYSLTLKCHTIGQRALKNLDRDKLIQETLDYLHQETGRIAQYSEEKDNQLVCLQSVGRHSDFFSIYTSVGGQSPLYCTSAGKAILSTFSNAEILDRWSTMDVKPLTQNTLTDIKSLQEDISATRRRGYALDLEENEYDLSCIGTIVRGADGTRPGAISLSGKPFSGEEEIERLAAILIPAATKLSFQLGYIPTEQ